jgi:hypothetical protein
VAWRGLDYARAPYRVIGKSGGDEGGAYTRDRARKLSRMFGGGGRVRLAAPRRGALPNPGAPAAALVPIRVSGFAEVAQVSDARGVVLGYVSRRAGERGDVMPWQAWSHGWPPSRMGDVIGSHFGRTAKGDAIRQLQEAAAGVPVKRNPSRPPPKNKSASRGNAPVRRRARPSASSAPAGAKWQKVGRHRVLAVRRPGGSLAVYGIKHPAGERQPCALLGAIKGHRTFAGRLPSKVAHVRAPASVPDVVYRLGDLEGVQYRSDKWDGRAKSYVHKFGRKRPALVSDAGGKLWIVGGGYKVRSAGIVG